MNDRIPTGLPATALIQQPESTVGADGVKSDPAAVEQVTRTCVPMRTLPGAAVCPRSVAQVLAPEAFYFATDGDKTEPSRLGALADDWTFGARLDRSSETVRQVAPVVNRWRGNSPDCTAAVVAAIHPFRSIPTDDVVRPAKVMSHAEKPATDIDPEGDGDGVVWAGPMVPFNAAHVVRALAAELLVDRHASAGGDHGRRRSTKPDRNWPLRPAVATC